MRKQVPRALELEQREHDLTALAVHATGAISSGSLVDAVVEVEHAGKKAGGNLTFSPQMISCNQSEVNNFNRLHRGDGSAAVTTRQHNVMRSLAEVKRIFGSFDIPIIVMSGVLLGWRRGCMAIPGDPDADVATFGPWLAKVGLQRLGEAFEKEGHIFDTSMCKDGVFSAGCELRVSFYGLSRADRDLGGTPYVDIEVLFSAPPPGVGRLPGVFDKCDENKCGKSCERCGLAYSLWSGSSSVQGRFYACPIPVMGFELATWMNQTFWVPAELDLYLEAEYGDTWQVPGPWPHYKPCQPYMDAEESFAPYASYVWALPTASAVMEVQRSAELREASRIRAAAEFELQLWGPAERAGAEKEKAAQGAPWRFPRDAGAPSGPLLASLARVAPHTFEQWGWVGTAVLASLAFWLMARSHHRGRAESEFLGLNSRLQISVFLAYISLSSAHMFLQHRAGSTGYSLISATLLIYTVKFLCAVAMFLRNTDGRVACLFGPAGRRFGRIPVVVLPLLPGGLLAGYDALSFMSLAILDPVSYQVLLHARLVLIALSWQFTFGRRLSAVQWFALILFATASMLKGIDQFTLLSNSTAYRGILMASVQICLAVAGNISSELLLKELTIPTDLLNACQYFQGLLVLLLASCATQGGPDAIFGELLAPAAWQRLLADQWMVASILCMSVFGIVTAYFLRELSNLLKELSACFVIIITAVVEWRILGWSACTPVGGQAVLLALLAVGVYNTDPLDNRRSSCAK